MSVLPLLLQHLQAASLDDSVIIGGREFSGHEIRCAVDEVTAMLTVTKPVNPVRVIGVPVQGHPVTTIHRWGDGQLLGIGRVDTDHWSHWHKDGGDWRRVGPLYPTRQALVLDSPDYKRSVWGI